MCCLNVAIMIYDYENIHITSNIPGANLLNVYFGTINNKLKNTI